MIKIFKTHFSKSLLLILMVTQNTFAAAETQCVRQAIVLGCTSDIAVKLCTGATSETPASCYREATIINRLTPDQALELCRPQLNCRCR